MSKKKERIKYLVGIHNALNNPIKGTSSKAQQTTYSKDTVLRMLKTVAHLLKEDGITPTSEG